MVIIDTEKRKKSEDEESEFSEYDGYEEGYDHGYGDGYKVAGRESLAILTHLTLFCISLFIIRWKI